VDDDFWWELERDAEDMEFLENNPSVANQKRHKKTNNKTQKLIEPMEKLDKTRLGKFLIFLKILIMVMGLSCFSLSILLSSDIGGVVRVWLIVASLILLLFIYPFIHALRVYLNNKKD